MNMIASISYDTATRVAAPELTSFAGAGIQIVAQYRTAKASFEEIYAQLDDAQDEASETHGHRPAPLIAWRHYSAIGAGEIEQMRDRLLKGGESADIVEQEYKAAKKRYRNILQAGKDWDQKTGLQSLMQKQEEARTRLSAARKQVAAFDPTTLEEAAALLSLVQESVDQFEQVEKWEATVLAKGTAFLSRHVNSSTDSSDISVGVRTRDLASAFSDLEGDFCDLVRMARVAELQVQEAIGELKHENGICVEVPDTETADLALFTVFKLMDMVKGLKTKWYQIHNEATYC